MRLVPEIRKTTPPPPRAPGRCASSMNRDVAPLLECSTSRGVWGFGYEKNGYTDRIVAEGTWKQFTQDSISYVESDIDMKFWIRRLTTMNGIVVYMEGTVGDEARAEDWAVFPSDYPCRWESLPDDEGFVFLLTKGSYSY